MTDTTKPLSAEEWELCRSRVNRLALDTLAIKAGWNGANCGDLARGVLLYNSTITTLQAENDTLKASVAVLVDGAWVLSSAIHETNGFSQELLALETTLKNLPASARSHMEMVEGLRKQVAALTEKG